MEKSKLEYNFILIDHLCESTNTSIQACKWLHEKAALFAEDGDYICYIGFGCNAETIKHLSSLLKNKRVRLDGIDPAFPKYMEISKNVRIYPVTWQQHFKVSITGSLTKDLVKFAVDAGIEKIFGNICDHQKQDRAEIGEMLDGVYTNSIEELLVARKGSYILTDQQEREWKQLCKRR